MSGLDIVFIITAIVGQCEQGKLPGRPTNWNREPLIADPGVNVEPYQIPTVMYPLEIRLSGLAHHRPDLN